MRRRVLILTLLFAAPTPAADLKRLPANTWVKIEYATSQPADPLHKGSFRGAAFNKIVYDTEGKRILFYDRWVDDWHGSLLYSNCLFALDPAAGKLTPIKIANWQKDWLRSGAVTLGYRTIPVDKEPTPCPRHVYHAFDHVPELNAVFICNGRNQSAIDTAALEVDETMCNGAWRLDLKTNNWKAIGGPSGPPNPRPNQLGDGMAYCPDIKSLVYAGTNRQIWILDLTKNEWRKAKHSPPPRTSMGQTIFYDAPRKRMLILGGGRPDAWAKNKALEFRELYAFDPKTEEVTRLADGPSAFYAQHFARDTKLDVFLAVCVFSKKEEPSGIFFYDPKKDRWSEVKSENPIPPVRHRAGEAPDRMQLCFDSEHGCFIAKLYGIFWAFRLELPKK
ncbi:MAG: hypothetical protein U0793_32655 [Gemmataceae bacterium]